jgi:hypothetical protein
MIVLARLAIATCKVIGVHSTLIGNAYWASDFSELHSLPIGQWSKPLGSTEQVLLQRLSLRRIVGTEGFDCFDLVHV